MTDSNIFVAAEAIPLASLPDIKMEQRKGDTTLRVTVTVNAAFSAAQIAACGVIGSQTTIGIGVTGGTCIYTGPVSGFGTRPSYSIVQIENAVCTFAPEQ